MEANLIRPGDTIATLAALPPEERERREGESFAAGLTATMPRLWADRLIDLWRTRAAAADVPTASRELMRSCRVIDAAHRAGVPADATDADLIAEADKSARDMERRLQQRQRIERAAREAEPPPASPWLHDARERVGLLAQFAEALHWLELQGIKGPPRRGSIRAWLARVQCPRWWRRLLRSIHARAVESTARTIGLVHKHAGLYVSETSAQRRAAQVARNARALESVHALNDRGQDYTLAELAAKGQANNEIRRHELMTRIAGFELIARELEHVALFVTVTCPSRMHAVRTAGPRCEPNPRHDGTTPAEAQAYLRAQWARFRSAADRAGLELYGFRIAEPNHDGTPHWHALLFFPRVATPPRKLGGAVQSRPAVRVAVRLLRRYFLWATDPAESGARRHRVTVERIDWSRGSAAGYVAKYVAKNIDGHRVEKDLYGNDAMTSSRRVDAWAATWRIRQFQQIGGAPVGVWRELRRLHPEQEVASGSPVVALGLLACNGQEDAQEEAEEGHDIAARETAAHGWADYLRLQGGARVPRRLMRLRVLRERTGELGRYGDEIPPRPVGIVTTHAIREDRPAVGIVPAMSVTVHRTYEVESERAAWLIVPREALPAARARIQGAGEPRDPWSPVNNCTGGPMLEPARLFAPPVVRVPKRGRWATWKRKGSNPGGVEDAKPWTTPTQEATSRPECGFNPSRPSRSRLH